MNSMEMCGRDSGVVISSGVRSAPGFCPATGELQYEGTLIFLDFFFLYIFFLTKRDLGDICVRGS